MCEEAATDARAAMCIRSMLLPEVRRISQRRHNVLPRMLLGTQKLGQASWLTWEGNVSALRLMAEGDGQSGLQIRGYG
jgi:hypothetical protein